MLNGVVIGGQRQSCDCTQRQEPFEVLVLHASGACPNPCLIVRHAAEEQLRRSSNTFGERVVLLRLILLLRVARHANKCDEHQHQAGERLTARNDEAACELALHSNCLDVESLSMFCRMECEGLFICSTKAIRNASARKTRSTAWHPNQVSNRDDNLRTDAEFSNRFSWLEQGP